MFKKKEETERIVFRGGTRAGEELSIPVGMNSFSTLVTHPDGKRFKENYIRIVEDGKVIFACSDMQPA